jgi:hypothetical protein
MKTKVYILIILLALISSSLFAGVAGSTLKKDGERMMPIYFNLMVSLLPSTPKEASFPDDDFQPLISEITLAPETPREATFDDPVESDTNVPDENSLEKLAPVTPKEADFD